MTAEAHEVSLLTFQPWLRQAGFVLYEDGVQRFVGHQGQLSWILIALVAVWAWRPGRLSRGTVAACTVPLLVIGLGPLLVIGDGFLPNPLYRGLAELPPFVRRLWWPGRAFAPVMVVLALAATVGLARLGHWRWLVAALWGFDLAASGLAPMPTWDATIPAGYRCLAEGPEGALIELPYGWTQAHLWYQTAHRRPILGGMLERNPVFQPDESVALRESNTLLQALLADTGPGRPPDVVTDEDIEQLYDLGYRYVALQQDALFAGEGDHPQLQQVRRTQLRRTRFALQARLGSPVYADERILIYAPWGDPRPCGPIDEDESPRPGTRGLATSSVKLLETVNLEPWMD